MAFVTAAIVAGGASLLGGMMSSNAASQAGQQAANAQNQATQAQLGMFNTVNNQNAPWRAAGQNALSELMTGIGMGGSVAPSGGSGTAASGSYNASQSGMTPGGLALTWNPLTVYNDSFTPGGYSLPATVNYDSLPAATKQWFFSDAAQSQVPGGVYLNPDGTIAMGPAAGSISYGTGAASAGAGASVSTAQSPGAGASVSAAQSPENGGITSGYFNHQFNNQDLNAQLAPNYAWQLGQGLGAVQNAGNLQSGLLSGNTLMGEQQYAQNYAGNAYQNAFNNYTTNQQNIFNRLSNIAGLGTSANNTVAPTAASLGSGMAQSIAGAGAAQAAGTVGSASALTSGLNNAASWYNLPSFLNGSSGTSGSSGSLGSGITAPAVAVANPNMFSLTSTGS